MSLIAVVASLWAKKSRSIGIAFAIGVAVIPQTQQLGSIAGDGEHDAVNRRAGRWICPAGTENTRCSQS